MKVGDLVCWTPHKDWSNNGGLGTIVETKNDPLLGWSYKIMWHVDIESGDNRFSTWYEPVDFDDEGNVGII